MNHNLLSRPNQNGKISIHKKNNMACHGLAVKSIELELWSGFESPAMTLCPLKQDTFNHDASSFGLDVKLLVPCVV